MARRLVFEAFYRHPPEKVWRALTEPEAIARWLMPNDFAARVGHRFQLRTRPQPGWSGIVNGEVLEADPPRRLVYTWQNENVDTVVAFTLTPTGGGTNLRLEHSGFRGFRAVMVSFMLGSGWKGIVRTHLPAVLERLDGST
jgi:uncharacterized protein YndB with AHSA1/START domain